MPSLLWVGASVWAQAPVAATLVHPDEAFPSRLALCQRELGATPSGDRQRLLRACLSRRLEGERIVERSCRRQASGVSGANERLQAQRSCERQALAVVSADLPKAPPPAPRPVLTVDTGGSGNSAVAVPTSATTVRNPASGEF